MNESTSSQDQDPVKAEHGARSEVTWDDGQGRQPYENQAPAVEGGAAASHDFAQGDRGESSGRNVEQLEQVKRKP